MAAQVGENIFLLFVEYRKATSEVICLLPKFIEGWARYTLADDSKSRVKINAPPWMGE